MADRSFLARLFRPALPEVKSVSTGVTFTGPDTANLSLLSSMLGAASRNLPDLERATAFKVSAYCYTAMLWRASRMASAPLMIVRETDDGEEWIPRHPLVPLLALPRPDLQMGELLERSQMYRDLTGEALWVTTRDQAGNRRLITPFSGKEFRSSAVPPLIYGAYEILGSDGVWRPVDTENIVHFRETNPLSWREPISKVDAALQQLDLGHNVNRIVKNFLTRAMFPGGIISPDKDWNPTAEEWENWKAQVTAWHAGPANQGLPLVVLGSTSFTPAASGLENLLPEAILDRVEACVGAVFGVPPVVLGWLSGMKNSPWSQMAEARRAAYEDTIAPLWSDVERRLTMAWLTPEEQAQGLLVKFDTSDVVALKGDQEQAARVAAMTSDVLTINERRLMLGHEPLPPDDERGEEIVGLIPAPAPSFGLGAGDPPPAEEEDPEEDDAPDLGKGEGKAADTKDLLWLIFDLSTKASEPSWERMIFSHLQALRAKMLAAATRGWNGDSATKATPTPEERLAAAQREMIEALEKDRPLLEAKSRPLIIGTGGAAVKRLGVRLGVSFSHLEPGLLKYASEESAFLAKHMGETTGASVAKVVQAQLEEGATLSGMRKALEKLPDFDRARAKLTARTETTRAWNGAQRRSLTEYQRSSGSRITKSWLSSRDDRVREEHAELDDGDYIGIDETFANGLLQPGEPNCRCTLLYAVDAGSTEEPSE